MPPNDPQPSSGTLLAEMKRRRVVRFIIGYAAAAFVVLQLAEIVFPAFGIGEDGLRILVLAVAIGFIPAVSLAWVYDITSEGIRRTEAAPDSQGSQTASPMLAFAVTVLLVATGAAWYVFSSGLLDPADGSPAASAVAYDPSRPIESLVVLPLQDYSADDQSYFAAAMHDAIISELSMIEGVRVVSRTTSMNYANTTLTTPEIGAELGVDVVIDGSVQRAGQQVRITLRVVDADTDSGIETIVVEGSTDETLDLQTEAAQRVATVIGSSYLRQDIGRTDLPLAAQDAYWRAEYEMERETEDGYRRAVELFSQALEAAPDFAEALAGRAAARFRLELWSGERRPEVFERARREAEAAVALDSTSLEAREVHDNIVRVGRQLGVIALLPGTGGDGSIVGRLRVDRDTVSLGGALRERIWAMARSDRGRQVEDALRSGSLSAEEALEQRILYARWDMSLGEFADAARSLEGVVAANPESSEAWLQLVRAYAALERERLLLSAVGRWSRSGAEGAPDQESVNRLTAALEADGWSGYWAWRRDDLLARQAAGEQIVLTDLAATYAALGDHARAYTTLGEAFAREESRLLALPNDPVWDPMRRDPEFQELVEQVEETRMRIANDFYAEDAPRETPGAAGNGAP